MGKIGKTLVSEDKLKKVALMLLGGLARLKVC